MTAIHSQLSSLVSSGRTFIQSAQLLLAAHVELLAIETIERLRWLMIATGLALLALTALCIAIVSGSLAVLIVIHQQWPHIEIADLLFGFAGIYFLIGAALAYGALAYLNHITSHKLESVSSLKKSKKWNL